MDKNTPGDVDAPESNDELHDSLRSFYIIAKFNAFYTTLFLISTFIAETFLNTIRLNEKIRILFERLINDWQPLQYFQGFYPSGDKPIEIVASAHVYVYIFAIAFYAGLRLVHHRTIENRREWPGKDDERKRNLESLSLFTRACWYVTPIRGVHQYVMRLWMLWGIIPVILTFPLSWLGVRVFTSENLITALIGSVILFGVNLIQDTNFFKKVPAKEVLGKMALSLISLGAHRNFTAFAKEMNILADGIKSGDIELVRTDIEQLDKLVTWADHLAKNPACDIRPPDVGQEPMSSKNESDVRHEPKDKA